MNSRALLRQSSRALSSSLRSSAARQQLRSQFHNNTPLAAQVASRQFQGRRFYATEPEAKKDEPEAEKKEAEVEDPTKKALEAKDKEIIDLKVCSSSWQLHSTSILHIHCGKHHGADVYGR